MAATEPAPSLPGSPGPVPSQGISSQDSPPARASGSPSEGIGLGRPPRPDSGSGKSSSKEVASSQQVPVAPALERKESEMSDNPQWQQLDKETERRSWLAGPPESE